MAKDYWNPKNYTVEQQLSDILSGKDVVVGEDNCVMKGKNNKVDVFYPSSSEKGHGHAVAQYANDGSLESIKIVHD